MTARPRPRLGLLGAFVVWIIVVAGIVVCLCAEELTADDVTEEGILRAVGDLLGTTTPEYRHSR